MSTTDVDELLALQMSLHSDGDDDSDDHRDFPLHLLADVDVGSSSDHPQNGAAVFGQDAREELEDDPVSTDPPDISTDNQIVPENLHEASDEAIALLLAQDDQYEGMTYQPSTADPWQQRIFHRYNSQGIRTMPTSRRAHASQFGPPPPRYSEDDSSGMSRRALPKTLESPDWMRKMTPVSVKPKEDSLTTKAKTMTAQDSAFLSVLNLDALQQLLDHMSYPDAFALGMTCRSLTEHIGPWLPKLKRQYATRLRDVVEHTKRKVAICGVCLYALEPRMLSGSPMVTPEGLSVCTQCRDLKKAKERLRRREAGEGEDDGAVISCMPVWRSCSRMEDWHFGYIWWRDTVAVPKHEDGPAYLVPDWHVPIAD